jgi:glycosyltransferase involved in cell wall biosynthesis
MNKPFVKALIGDPISTPLSVAVVICTHNRPAALDRCLRQLLKVNTLNYRAIVVDSAPNSSAARDIAVRHGAQYILAPLKGLSRARNIGTRATDADIIAYLDDDMVPHPRWLNSLVREFADERVMAATGPILGLELYEGSDVDLRLATELDSWGPNRFQIDRLSRQWFERTNFGGIGDGNFAIRRPAFESIIGFDERLGRAATIDTSEEHYAYFRLVENGFKVAYSPQAVVFHPNPPLTSDILKKRITDAAAFASFLASQHPFYSLRVAKFLIGGLFHTKRWWHPSPRFEVVSLSTGQQIRSAIGGLLTFLRSVGAERPKKPIQNE